MTEGIIFVTLVLLWATIALATGKCCPFCGKPEADCTCSNDFKRYHRV